jgi:type IV secretory pathway VirB2 component (pilin)
METLSLFVPEFQAKYFCFAFLRFSVFWPSLHIRGAILPRNRRSKEASEPMRISLSQRVISKTWRTGALSIAASLALAESVYAQGDPWDQAVQTLQTAFTGTIATGLALVAIVVGGLMFAFGEGGAKRTLAGVIFGVGMAVGAVNFMSWLFP